MRFYKPAAGTIELDGHDIGGLQVADLRRAVQLVAQEPFLSAGSIEDNIRYGSADVLPRRLEEAVHGTGLDVWLQRLSRGLRTPLEEAGRNLSVGQKQRLALARAVVADRRS